MDDTAAQPSEHPDDQGRRFDDMVGRVWGWMVGVSPELATYVGEAGEPGWTDYSGDAVGERRGVRRRLLDDVRGFPTAGLDHQRRVTHQVTEAYLAAEVAIDAFPHEATLVDQTNGVHLGLTQTLDYMRLDSAEDGAAYVERLRRVPALLDQVVELLRQPEHRRNRPPRVVLADVPRQVEALRPPDGPLVRRLAEATGAGRVPDGQLDTAADVIRDDVHPALDRFARFVADELLPEARDEVGLGALPDGDAWYAAAIAHQTSVSPTPQEVHDLGLAEVARIWDAMEELAGGDVAAFRRRLDDDPATWFATADDQLAAYRALCKEVDARLWQVVTDLPRMPYGVEAMPDYMAVSAPTAYYIPGAGGARRPGTFIVNGHDLPSRPSWRMVPLSLHEAVPGHHLQHAVADELGELPPIRRHLGWNAYVEGWGLYAEHLGEELGLYRSDADRYGRLSFDMWRAARLVVDTGIHAFGWDRDRAIAYVEETTGLGHHDVVSEVDRYISWPGQALGYKLGEQVILGLRREAEAARGPAFRPQPFHDVVLGSGPVPLPVLEAEVRRWLATAPTPA